MLPVRLLLVPVISAAFVSCKPEILEQPANESGLLSSKEANLLEADVPGAVHVMSFNIRHHNDNDPQSLDERKDMILQVVLDNDPDIVGLQEFSNGWFKTWMTDQMTSSGYAFYTDSSVGNPKIIFYKANRFTRLDEGNFYLQLTDNRNGTWVILRDEANGREYFVSNSHWSHTSQSDRIAMANLISGVVEENSQGLPLILFGDFNARPGTEEISVIKNIRSNNSLVCAHSESGHTFHGWDATGTSKLDWIFSSRDLAFTSSSVIETSYNGNWPSDHWPVTATFVPAVFGPLHYDTRGISAGSNTRYYFADVTGDGLEDKIYWNPTFDSGHTRVYESNGDGTFSFLNSNTNGASESNNTTFYFADVTGDGRADKIYWNPTFDSGHTRVYGSNGDGTFTFLDSNTNGSSESSNTTFYFADVTGDGRADKIYWNPTYDTGHTRVYGSNGDGTFTFLDSNTNGKSESSNTTFYFADVNGDGRADKIYWNPTFDDGHTRVYLSNGDGTFSWSNSNTNGWSQSNNTTFYFTDVTGDGRADKIYWNPNNYMGKLKLYRSNGDGTFEDPVYSLRGTSQSSVTRFYFADINGDGKADQIRWNYQESPGGHDQGTLKNYFAN